MRLIVCLLALIPFLAEAQALTPSSIALTIAWTAPTTGGGGTEPLTGINALTQYNVYASTTALTTMPSMPTATSPANALTATGSISASPGQTVYVYVTACDQTGCSPFATAGTATYVIPVIPAIPDPPAKVTITVNIT
jgi:hypothetical protein